MRFNSVIVTAKLEKEGERYNLNFKIHDDKYSFGSCPKCGKKVIVNRAAYTCEDKECNFCIFKNDKFLARYGKKTTDSMIRKLLKDGQVKVGGLKSPNGKGKFEAILKLKENGKYWGWEMEFENKTSVEDSSSSNNNSIVGKCLECGSDVYENSKAFSCSNDKCKFVLFKNDFFFKNFNKKLTKTLVKEFLENKKAKVTGLYSQKKNKKFDANVVLKKQGDYWNFNFENNG